MKRLTVFIIFCLSCFFIGSAQASISYDDIMKVDKEIVELEHTMWAAHDMAEAARKLEREDVVKTAQEEYQIAEQKYHIVMKNYENMIAIWQEKRDEYPEATRAWEFLKEQGYSDAVAAGIIGNMCVEVGGSTLKLDSKLKTSSYYGICQWSSSYKEVWDGTLEEQLVFLANTIEYEFNVYGYAYKNNFTYEDFIKLRSPKDASLAFSKCYERCKSTTYGLRQNCAEEAYKYFTK